MPLYQNRHRSLLPLLFCAANLIVGTLTFHVRWRGRPFSQGQKRTKRDFLRHEFSSALCSHSIDDKISTSSDFFGSLSVDQIQKDLVRRGLAYSRRQKDASSNSEMKRKESEFAKVNGCTANVYVKTVLIADRKASGWKLLSLEGSADAFISRGLLAVLADTVQNEPVDNILNLSPINITQRLGIDLALSPGRNDGMASMLRTVQAQILALSTEKSHDMANVESQQGISEKEDSAESKEKVPTVALLLSGGVDSSVALNLLKQEGYNVTAFYLKIWLEDELSHLGQCPWEDDYRMCQAVCEQAQVPLEAISLQEAYKDRVISYTVGEAEQGRTPNPDIMCNSRVKFGCFYDEISTREFDFIATGHYAQLRRDQKTGEMHLYRAPDPVKDQSYFLCALNQEQLRRVKFPIGHLQKSQVRDLADQYDLPNRERPDSQGLCFLGKVKFSEFLAAYLGERPGDIIDATTGERLGRHKGVWYHTVGQRKGIGNHLDPLATSRGPWFVVAKDPHRNLVFCSNRYDEEAFSSSRSKFTVRDIHWIPEQLASSFSSKKELHLTMKIRHGPSLVNGTLTLRDGTDYADIELEQKDKGLAPGQYVAFYEHEECLGGGVISEQHWTEFLLQQEQARAKEEPMIRNATLSR